MGKWIWGIVMVILTVGPIWSQDKVAPFTLSDQKEQRHTIQFPCDKKRVLIIGDQTSAPQARLWGENLYRTYSTQMDFIPIAAMGNIPEIFRGFARAEVKNKRPTLLDWDNKVSKKLGYEQGQCIVLIVDRDGSVLGKGRGPYSSEKLGVLVAACVVTTNAIPTPNPPPTPSSEGQ